MKRKHVALLLIAALLCAVFPLSLMAQEVVTSASGAGYGGSGGFNTNAAWLTSGTAIRIFPAPYMDTSDTTNLANPSMRYRYLPFALYLFPDHMKAYATSPVHYNMHYDPVSGNISYSTLPTFDLENPGLSSAFRSLYDSGSRLYEENLFTKRMLEMNVNGKDFKIDWSATTEPRLVKEFFFSDTVPLSGQWQAWFGSDWAAANLAMIKDYCAAATYAAMMLPSYVGGSGGGTWNDPSGNPMLYELPSSSYTVPAATESYHNLYNELMNMFLAPDGEFKWALIWEPVADYYPQGNPNLRAWSSASDIAQVLAEKAFEDEETYRLGHTAAYGAGESLLKPVDGNYTRYFAKQFFMLRNTSIFNDFLFRQTRAIFTNNYSGIDYIADQFLLADSLRPEVNNEKGFLGGWAIVYLRDLAKLEPKLDALRYGLLIDQQNLSIPGSAYGNIATFSAVPPPPTVMSWFQQPDGVQRDAYLDTVAAANTPSIGNSIGLSDLGAYNGLYTATQEIYLDCAWLSATFTKNNISPGSALLNRDLLQLIPQPVSGNVIGTARYGASEASIRDYLASAGDLILNNLKTVSEGNIGFLGMSSADIASSMNLKPLSAVQKGKSGEEFAVGYLNSAASLSASVVKNASGTALTSQDDGEALLCVSGKLPINYALRLPQTKVKAKIITMDLGTPITITTEEPEFSIDELFEYTPGDCPVIVLGWKDQDAVPDIAAIQGAALSLPAVPSAADIASLKATAGAELAFELNCGEKIQGAASPDGSGGYTGITVVVISLQPDTLDLAMETVTLKPTSLLTAIAEVCANNDSENTITTKLRIVVDNPSQTYIIDVTLVPGLNCFDVPFNLPPDGGLTHVDATINPDHNPDEVDYSNNDGDATISTPPPAPAYVYDSSDCYSDFWWAERRWHSWTIVTPTWGGGTHTQYYYCFHTYIYHLEITPTMTIGYRDAEFDIPVMKSGYGFTPNITLTVTVTLDEHSYDTSFCNGHHPSSTSQAVVTMPNVAYFGWYSSVGHSQSDYVIINYEKGTRQEYSSIALEHTGTSGNVSTFTAAANPLSNSLQRRIYTNVALRDGSHSFYVDFSGGGIRYTVDSLYGAYSSSYQSWMDPDAWNFDHCLATATAGEVTILGSMYEDDFTGATIP